VPAWGGDSEAHSQVHDERYGAHQKLLIACKFQWLMFSATAARTVVEIDDEPKLLRFLYKANEREVSAGGRDDFYSLLEKTPDLRLPSVVTELEILVREEQADERSVLERAWKYLVVTGLGGGRAKKMACHPKTRHLKLVPVRTV